MFLQKRGDIYDAVNLGCSVKIFSINNDLVDFNGDKISIDEFKDKLSLQANRKIIDDKTEKQIPMFLFYYIISVIDKTEKQISIFYYIIPVIVILIVLFFIIIKLRKK